MSKDTEDRGSGTAGRQAERSGRWTCSLKKKKKNPYAGQACYIQNTGEHFTAINLSGKVVGVSDLRFHISYEMYTVRDSSKHLGKKISKSYPTLLPPIIFSFVLIFSGDPHQNIFRFKTWSSFLMSPVYPLLLFPRSCISTTEIEIQTPPVPEMNCRGQKLSKLAAQGEKTQEAGCAGRSKYQSTNQRHLLMKSTL